LGKTMRERANLEERGRKPTVSFFYLEDLTSWTKAYTRHSYNKNAEQRKWGGEGWGEGRDLGRQKPSINEILIRREVPCPARKEDVYG